VRILITQPSCHVYGGAELAIAKLSQYLLSTNNEVGLLTAYIDERMIEDLKGVYAITHPIRDPSKIKVVHFNMMRTWLEQNYKKWDIINTHNHPCELFLPDNKDIPNIWYHNEPPSYALRGNPIEHKEKEIVQKSISRVVVADEFNRNRVKKLYGMESEIIPYGVDTEFWNPEKADPKHAERVYGLDENDFVVLHPGWYHPMKNQGRSLYMMKRLVKDIPNIKLVFSGSPTEYIETLRQLTETFSLGNRVVFETTLGRKLLRDLYSRANVVIFPYKPSGGFLSIFDSLAMRKNIIVFPTTTCSYMIKENHLGIVTEELEPDILELYKNPISLCSNSREWVQKNLTWEQYTSGLLSIFKEELK